MSQVINTNLMSINARRNLSASQSAMASAVQRLSSGLRVNSAKDDAAGLAIAERMSAKIRGMNVAIRNANDGISLAQTAEGALGKVTEALQRMRELAVQAANATNGSTDRASLDAEYQQLGAEIQRVLAHTTFNDTNLFTSTGSLTFQVSPNAASSEQVSIDLGSTAFNADTSVSSATNGAITTVTGAQTAITDIDSALDAVNSKRAAFGAAQNRFESVIGNLSVAVENMEASRSRIMDADYAAETAALTRAQILQQAGVAMLAQANALPQNVLSLLRG
jgi:flagellin